VKRLLHILTNENDTVADRLISEQQKLAGHEVVTADLTVATPDYTHLLQEIFAADSVTVW
jgi:hypothetical protein